jgi:hypothetical protein
VSGRLVLDSGNAERAVCVRPNVRFLVSDVGSSLGLWKPGRKRSSKGLVVEGHGERKEDLEKGDAAKGVGSRVGRELVESWSKST